MARRTRLIKLATIKAFMWLLLCALLLSKTKQVLQRMNFEINNFTLVQDYYSSMQVTLINERTQCSESERLGLPKYVADRCPPEDHHPCSNLTCANLLFSGNASIYDTAREFMKLHAFPRLQDADFANMTKDCSAFRLQRGYEQKMKNDYEDFPIAFNLIVHEDVEQIERLIYALYRPRNRFCVHLDLKSPKVTEAALEGISRCLPNVFMSSERIDIYWGDYNRLLADIYCMRDHVTRVEDWRYLINSAGQAFPIRSMSEMVEILKIYNGANDIEGMTGFKVIKGRFQYEFERDGDSNVVRKQPNVRHPNPPHDIEIVRGSAYGVFSRGFIEYVVTDERAKDLLKWAKGTFSPDEMYWATLHHTFTNPHLHPPGGYAGDPNVKPWLAVYANWFELPCKGFQRHGVCVFGVEDVPHLVNRKEFFVNKFVTDFQPLGLECLRTWIDFKESCTGLKLLDTDFYKSLPFIKRNRNTLETFS